MTIPSLQKMIHTAVIVLCLITFSGYIYAGEKPPEDLSFANWLKRDFSPEKELFKQIRRSLITGETITIDQPMNFPFNPNYSLVGLTLFQPGEKPLRFLSKRDNFEATINRIITKLRERKRFHRFNTKDKLKTRILLEVITEESEVDINLITFQEFSTTRFEPGITGLHLKHQNGNSVYYMPTDATVYSHLSPKHIFNAIAKKTPIGKKTNKISERIKLLEKEPYQYFLTKSVAFISFEDSIVPLYRGYPVPISDSRDFIFESTKNSVDWLVKNMEENGQFLYYYDGVGDTIVDHQHPGRSSENLYYNSLRHSGGTITLLRMYELTRDKKYLTAGKLSLKFLLENLKKRQINGKDAYYLRYNKKSKLGGTGVALVAFMRYHILTGDNSYNDIMAGMVRHLLSRIDETGEFIGYYIHPRYNDGNPINNPPDEIKKQLFSFYYPGEALMGLALYTNEMPISPQDKNKIKLASLKALDWLVAVRPKKYPDLFKPLPSDGWLMQAIEEWSHDPDFLKQSYLDFVFDDANKMISQMYQKDNSPYYDYPGTFYYHYGDHAYVDGARAEGLISAYYLAHRLNKTALYQHLYSNIKTVARSLLFTYNSKQSTYMYLNPDKAIGAFRFKFTRQWMRVDSVQHTACFLIRLLLAPPPDEVTDLTRRSTHPGYADPLRPLDKHLLALGLEYPQKHRLAETFQKWVPGYPNHYR